MRVRVQPRASRNRIAGVHGGRLKLQVTAPPVDGAANRAVVELLAEALALPRRLVEVVSGASSREKTVAVAADAGQLRERLQSLVES